MSTVSSEVLVAHIGWSLLTLTCSGRRVEWLEQLLSMFETGEIEVWHIAGAGEDWDNPSLEDEVCGATQIIFLNLTFEEESDERGTYSQMYRDCQLETSVKSLSAFPEDGDRVRELVIRAFDRVLDMLRQV